MSTQLFAGKLVMMGCSDGWAFGREDGTEELNPPITDLFFSPGLTSFKILSHSLILIIMFEMILEFNSQFKDSLLPMKEIWV